MRLDKSLDHPLALAGGLDPAGPVLVLSRRNLEGLLEKLDDPDSHRTIVAPSAGPGEARPFAVAVEENEEHYAHPSRRGAGPGPMLTRGRVS